MKKLCNYLITNGHLNQEQLFVLRDQQKQLSKSFCDLIVELGYIPEEKFKNILSEFFNIPFFDIEKEIISLDALKVFPYEFVKKHNFFPVRIEENGFVLVMADPFDLVMRDIILSRINTQLKLLISTKNEITYLIDKYYSSKKEEFNLNNFINEISNASDDVNEIKTERDFEKQILDIALEKGNDSYVVKLLNTIFKEAVQKRATDVHIDPQEKYVDVRFRIDGVLKSAIKVPNSFRMSLAARIKIITSLNIAETRAVQDGRASIYVSGKKVDIRIATVPTFYGEKISMRLLDQSKAKLEFASIGLNENEAKIIKEAIYHPQGIILTVGPTGSGKTSTLYSALNLLRKNTNKHIVTIEDPVEYLIEGVNQIQVNPAKNITFSVALRAVLRMDPNVVLVGEIRDKETADIAFRASLTGHLVLSTLHTNGAVSTITRLLDIGMEPYLIGSTLSLIIAQRLVKLICPHCIYEYTPNAQIVDKLRFFIDEYNINNFYKGMGCAACNFTGYLGRTAIFEIFEINQQVKRSINERASETKLLELAKKNGFRTLIQSGMEKVGLRLTTLEELVDIAEIASAPDIESKTFNNKINNRFLKLDFGYDKAEDIYG